MVNATEMAKIYDKQVVAFMRNEDTQNFIAECLKSENSHFINISKEEDLYRSAQKSGTYMHRVLALKFAAWLSPRFELWVYSTIEQLLFGKHVERERSFERTLFDDTENCVVRISFGAFDCLTHDLAHGYTSSDLGFDISNRHSTLLTFMEPSSVSGAFFSKSSRVT